MFVQGLKQGIDAVFYSDSSTTQYRGEGAMNEGGKGCDEIQI